jgi:hypothetical protein
MRSVSASSCRLRASESRRGVTGRWLAVCAIALLTGVDSVHGQVAQALRVIPLVRADQVEVSFELKEGFTPEVRAAIHSGLKTTFTYTVDLRLDVAGWFDRTIGSAVVTTSVQYKNLPRKYAIEHRIDGRVEKSLDTEDEATVRRWLTTMQGLQLFPTSVLERNREYYVRVNATARPSHGALLWPFGSGTSAQTKFTFIR